MSGADFSPNTPSEEREMLDAIGIDSIQNLFESIPDDLRTGPLNLSEGLSEFELMQRFEALVGKNAQGTVGFVGAGYYDHVIPSVVDHLAGRAEFSTSYTPYQPECSQGTLQALYEYQTVMCALTGMEVSNASLYDGGTALAEAALMALRVTGRKKVVLDGGVNPAYRRIVRTYLSNLPVSVIEVSPRQGISHRPALVAALDDSTAAVIIQNPDFFGGVDDYGDLAEEAHSRGALLVASVYPISLGLLKAPGETGADIVVGDGQSLGNPLNFGGPSFGFITTHREYVRSLPGRLVGETIDKEGRRGFVLTLQTREQHIKRHRATSNICSNQSLCALRGLMFLCSLGREGLVELARLNYDKAEYAKALLGEIKGVSVLNAGATFNEFTLALPTGGAQIAEKLLAAGIAAGIPLGPYFADMEHCLVVTVTEKRTKKEIETFARRLEEALWS